MGIDKPTPEVTAGPTYAYDNDAALDVIDAHDHTAGKGVKVPSAGINVDAALEMNGNDLTELQRLSFNDATALSGNLNLSVNGGELYWRTSGGASVKLTNGASINTTLVGGITGDYSSTNADVEYEDAGKRYKFLQDEGHWANIDAGELRIYEPTSGITKAVTIKSPTGLATAYDITLPAAAPAALALVMMTSGGVLQTSDAVNAPAFTVASNSDITLQGTGKIVHGSRVDIIHAAAAAAPAGAPSYVGPYWSGGSGDVVHVPIRVQQGSRIVSMIVRNYKTGAGTTVLALKRSTSGSVTTVFTVNRTSTTGWAATSLSPINYTSGPEEYLYFEWSPSSAGERLEGLVVTRDQQ
jgi:hypothetical protein